MYIVKLKPAYKDYIWGGQKLKNQFNKQTTLEKVAETWECSTHSDGLSVVWNGEFAGKTLSEMLDIWGLSAIGRKAEGFEFFPVLVKLIDASDKLSVQVHPSDEYALENEHSFGKTEFWYVIDADDGAELVYGLNKDVDKNTFLQLAETGELNSILNYVPVKKGDTFFIEAGLIHAIGKGIIIAEIQQNSNLTYRVFDYNRVGADGKLRDLHVEKAANVAFLGKTEFSRKKGKCVENENSVIEKLCSCKYFSVNKIDLNGDSSIFHADSFTTITVIDGSGTIGDIEVEKGDSVFIPAEIGRVKICGNFTALKTFID